MTTNKYEKILILLSLLLVFTLGHWYGVHQEGKITDIFMESSDGYEELYKVKCKQYLELATWFDEAVEQLEDCKAKHPKKYY